MIGGALVSSDWSAQDSLGTELRVISIGEGILAGLAYFVFGAVSLHSLQAGHRVVSLTLSLLTLVTRNVPNNSVFISASKSSIRRFVITEKAPTRHTHLRHY